MIKINSIVKSKIHDSLTTWIVKDIVIGISGRKIFECEAQHDTLLSRGFDKVNQDFYEKEIHLDS